MKKRTILISFVLIYFFVGFNNLQAQDNTLQELKEIVKCEQINKT